MSRIVGALALVPSLALVALPSTAEAASGSLSLSALDRKGHSVAVTAKVYSLVHGNTYKVRSGKTRSLPKGRYAVMLSIDAGNTSTLAAKVITVNGKEKLRFDARQGKPLGTSLNVGFRHDDYASVCASISGSWEGVSTWAEGGSLYVIPSSAKELRSGFYSHWSGDGSVHYYAAGSGKGLKAGRSYRTSSLAKVAVQLRGGTTLSRDSDVRLQPAMPRGCELYGMSERGDAPMTLNSYVSPGSWQAQAGTWAPNGWRLSDWSGPWRRYAAGKRYTEVFNRAVWGPRDHLPKVSRGKLSYWPDDLIADPSKGGSEGAHKAAITLRKGSKVIKKKTVSQWGGLHTFDAKLPSSGWYTMTVDARRYHPKTPVPAGILSPRVTISWRFHAKSGKLPLSLARFSAWGLNAANQAAPKSTTTLAMALDAVTKPRKVTVEASFDEGRTWRRVSIRRAATGWEVKVPNPASGYVALRSTVEEAKGGRSVQTIYRAYSVR